MRIRCAYADLTHGQVHYAECGDVGAPAVLLLHQTPRSWAEYRAVLPLLGTRYRALAMDTAGFGNSDPSPGPASIEAWASAAVQLLDTLAIEHVHVVGHHTGGVIALELAACHSHRVRSLVLSSTPYTDEAFRVRAPSARRSIQCPTATTARTWRSCGASGRPSIPPAGQTFCRPSSPMR